MEKRRAARKSGNELLYGRHCVEEALKARRREFLRLWVRRGPLRSESESALALAAQVGLKPISVDSDKMSKIIGLEDSSRPEIALEAGPIPCWNSTGELCRVLASEPGKRRIVALDGVEDPQNVGSIARVANAAGAEGLPLFSSEPGGLPGQRRGDRVAENRPGRESRPGPGRIESPGFLGACRGSGG